MSRRGSQGSMSASQEQRASAPVNGVTEREADMELNNLTEEESEDGRDYLQANSSTPSDNIHVHVTSPGASLPRHERQQPNKYILRQWKNLAHHNKAVVDDLARQLNSAQDQHIQILYDYEDLTANTSLTKLRAKHARLEQNSAATAKQSEEMIADLEKQVVLMQRVEKDTMVEAHISRDRIRSLEKEVTHLHRELEQKASEAGEARRLRSELEFELFELNKERRLSSFGHFTLGF